MLSTYAKDFGWIYIYIYCTIEVYHITNPPQSWLGTANPDQNGPFNGKKHIELKGRLIPLPCLITRGYVRSHIPCCS